MKITSIHVVHSFHVSFNTAIHNDNIHPHNAYGSTIYNLKKAVIQRKKTKKRSQAFSN